MQMRSSLLLGGGLAAVALKTYNHISGQNLVRDFLDSRRFEGMSLASAAETWSRNRCRSDLIVCLTSIPGRIEHVGGTLKSLLVQGRAPREIRLHVPEFSRREGKAYTLPGFLAQLPGVKVVPCEDQGPSTKLLPALRDLPPDQPIVVVDDDMLYPGEMLDHFHRISLRFPERAVGSSGWRVPGDLTDRPTNLKTNLLHLAPAPVKCTRLREPWRTDILQGYSGYLVRPRFFAPEVHNYDGAPEAAFFVDDVWLSAHIQAEKWVHPAARFPFESPRLAAFFKSSSLGLINRGGGDPNRRNNTTMIRYFENRWLLRS
jgi:hypothetical protein